MSKLIGQSLGRYHILEQLGEGGMATVYRAYDTRLERDVAIKIIRRDAFPPNQLDRILKRFEREAKALAKLSHPNIIKVIDYGGHEGSPYLIMEYLQGGTLKQRLGKPISWHEAVQLVVPIAEALEYAHEHLIIHRDIKPSNILLTEKGQPMLTDFGIAKILETEETATLTGMGIGVGTPEYMAPEQWIGQSSPRSDIYSLGVVLYEMITGRKPYVADTPAAILLKQASDPIPRPKNFARDLPDAIEQLLIKALAKEQGNRYSSMADFLVGLQNLPATSWKQNKPIKTYRQKPHPQVRSDKKLSRSLLAMALLTMVLLVTAVFAVLKLADGGSSGINSRDVPGSPSSSPGPSITIQTTGVFTGTPGYTTMPDALNLTRIVERCGTSICIQDGQRTILTVVAPAIDSGPITGSFSWSPDGIKFVFDAGGDPALGGRRDLYIYNTVLKSTTKITKPPNNNQDPSWSPDGKYIVFQSNCLITLMDVNKNQVVASGFGTDNTGCPGTFRWSPDSNWFAWLITQPFTVGISNVANKNASVFPMKNPGRFVKLAWSADGIYIHVNSGSLQFARLDVQCLKESISCTGVTWEYASNFAIPDSWSPYFYPQWQQ